MLPDVAVLLILVEPKYNETWPRIDLELTAAGNVLNKRAKFWWTSTTGALLEGRPPHLVYRDERPANINIRVLDIFGVFDEGFVISLNLVNHLRIMFWFCSQLLVGEMLCLVKNQMNLVILLVERCHVQAILMVTRGCKFDGFVDLVLALGRIEFSF